MAQARVGWIGLGKMGAPMARNLLRAGFTLTVFNRTQAKANAFEAEGAAVAKDLRGLADGADIVISMIADDAVLEAITIAPDGVFEGLRRGSVFIDMSTVSPGLSACVAQAANDADIAYLRAPVSGSVGLAEAGTLSILVSGPRNTFDECQDLFSCMGKHAFYLGEGEQARYLKLAVNMMVGITAGMMAEALALGRRGGLDWAQMIDVIAASAVASPLVGYKAAPLKQRDFRATFPATMMAKDFDLALDAAHAASVPVPLTSLMREQWSAMRASGRGEEDFFVYVALLEAHAGLNNG